MQDEKIQFIRKLMRYPAGTMLSVNGSPYVKVIDSVYHKVVGYYIDVLTGELVHPSTFFGKKVNRCYGSEIMW